MLKRWQEALRVDALELFALSGKSLSDMAGSCSAASATTEQLTPFMQWIIEDGLLDGGSQGMVGIAYTRGPRAEVAHDSAMQVSW